MSSKRITSKLKKAGEKTQKYASIPGVSDETSRKLLMASGAAGNPIGLMATSLDPKVLDAQADSSGTISVGRRERLREEGIAEQERLSAEALQAEEDRRQQLIREQEERDEASRSRIRQASGGGYASTILSGLTGGGSASRRLYGS